MLTSAILEEHEAAAGEKNIALKSGKLLQRMKKLRNRGKESDSNFLETHGLQVDVKLSYIHIGLKETHPVIRLDDYVQMLSRENRLDLLTGGHDFCSSVGLFWTRFEEENPGLVQKLKDEKGDLECCLPLAVYGDEGQSHKKAQFLIFATQPTLGFGTSFTQEKDGHASDLGVNMMGVSCLTRFVYSVMKASLYNRTPDVFMSLLTQFSNHVEELYRDGIRIWHSKYGRHIVIYPTVLFVKGDWPWLKKAGNLVRTHHQAVAHPGRGRGICHLCLAGTPDHADWSDVNGSWLCESPLQTDQAPWVRESPLLKLCQFSGTPAKALWFRPDLFHTLHKGVLSELAGSALVSHIHLGDGCFLVCVICFALFAARFKSGTKTPKSRWKSFSLVQGCSSRP